MSSHRNIIITVASLALFTGLGCEDSYPVASQPPPPPVYDRSPDVVRLADQNGFRNGEADGERDYDQGRPFRARSTRAYRDAPGFDPNLGSFDVYVNAFRLSYLRGYDQGFRRRG